MSLTVARCLLLAAAAAGCAMSTPQASETACPDLSVGGLRCTGVTVPENRTTGRGRTITLRVAVLPARGADRAPDPVFFLAGGPGQAATVFLRDPGIGRNPLGERRDLVFLDQRGTGGSNPLLCDLYPASDYDEGRFADFLPVARVRACRETLEARADLAQYTTAASVADLEDVRKALGYERINLSGSSYGTRLAMEYVRTHPDRVRTVTLGGAVPASLRMPEGFGRAAQDALDGLLAECLATDPCARAFPDIQRESKAVFERLARGPITTSLPGQAGAVRMTRSNVAEAIRYLTYSSRGASRVPALLHRAYEGDFSGIAAYLRDYRQPGTFEALYLSVTCAEDVPFLSPDAGARDAGTYLGEYRVRQQQAACAEWRRGTVPAWHGEPVRADVPVLMTTGLLDPVTPPAGADAVARTLPNSLLVKVPSGGHGLRGLRGLDCLAGIERAFVERGTVAGLDTACVRGISRPAFDR